MNTTQEQEHTLTIEDIPHHCGGYELHVTCSCGYEGVAASIGFGCADRDELQSRLDPVHAPLLALAVVGPVPAWLEGK